MLGSRSIVQVERGEGFVETWVVMEVAVRHYRFSETVRSAAKESNKG